MEGKVAAIRLEISLLAAAYNGPSGYMDSYASRPRYWLFYFHNQGLAVYLGNHGEKEECHFVLHQGAWAYSST